MEVVLFSKLLQELDVGGLIDWGHKIGLDGYDLCVRPGHPVNPDNAGTVLPEVVKRFEAAALRIPMVTGNFDLLYPQNRTAEPVLAAMDKADVRLIKLGYFTFDPLKDDYWSKVDEIRAALEGWEKLARRYNVKICYHTHSGFCMGLNCAALMHLIKGFDPDYIGAYIDPGHMAIDGEPFAFGVAMVKDYLSIVSLKDAFLSRVDSKDEEGVEAVFAENSALNNVVADTDEGGIKAEFRPAGMGMVAWSKVFAELRRIGFDGPMSVQPEFQLSDGAARLAELRREVAYFRRKRDGALASRQG